MKPLFINSSTGKLFAIYYPISEKNSCQKALIHVPAFAEEMNTSRKKVALQAREFRKQGYAVLILDLFGTGESDGDFGDATWKIWLQNIDTAIEWLHQQDIKTITLWGMRVGALLSRDFVHRYPYRVQRLILSQPVLNGDVFVTQLLRLRVAAAMMNPDAPREKTADLKQQLQNGQKIEVAGYWLNPALIKPLMACRAENLNLHGIEHDVLE